MVAYLSKSDANEGFNQIIDFLNGSFIKYALIVNPNIYVSCIKQFWTTVAAKKVNYVIRLQALVDKKKVVVMEATIRDALHLDDAKGVECLPNEEIFIELARIGYEKPSIKLTFYKAFFSSHLVRNVDSPSKFYMYPRSLQLMIRKQVGDLSTHTTKYTSSSLTQKVYANIRRVGKGFSGVETPLFEGMLVAQEVAEKGDANEHVENVNAGDATEGDVNVANDEVPTTDEEPFITSPTPPTPPPQPSQDIPSTSQRIDTSDDTVMEDVSNHGRMIADMDVDADVVWKKLKRLLLMLKLIKRKLKLMEVLIFRGEHTTITAAKAQVPAATLTVALARVTAAPSRRRKGVGIRDPQEEFTTSTIISAETKSKDKELKAGLNKNIDWDEAIDHVKKKAKEDNVVKRYQAIKRKLQTEAQARKNMMVYLKNVVGFKMDYFKGMSYDDIRPIFERYFDSNVTFLQNTKEQIEEKESCVSPSELLGLTDKPLPPPPLSPQTKKEPIPAFQRNFDGHDHDPKSHSMESRAKMMSSSFYTQKNHN
nr:hypothetical protein [Tanacetum cinerariifolium]GEZ65614.1 hypothetical protein [Tanacetum cinerariifolium]